MHTTNSELANKVDQFFLVKTILEEYEAPYLFQI